MVFNPTLLAGGYVTDMLLTLSFDGEAWEEADLGKKHRGLSLEGTLLIGSKRTDAHFGN